MSQPTKQEVKKWYNTHHHSFGKDSWRPPEAYHPFLNFIDIQPAQKMLDIGCGTGYLLKEASQRGLETFGIDISEEAVKISRHQSSLSVIKVGRAEALPFKDDTFDHIFCLGSLEHFLDIKKALNEMKRVARQGATFCIMVPNYNYLYWKFKPTRGTEQQEINEHLLSLDEWTKIFEDQGFKIQDIYKDQWPLYKAPASSSQNSLKWLKAILRKIVWRFLPLRYTYQFIFIMRFK
ncbi:MAG: class I SAM-dependent methyltransferase [Balneolaceae bacterium]|nr:class I SAM-dependent methyltransferase [Balneolaceae bacterium]